MQWFWTAYGASIAGLLLCWNGVPVVLSRTRYQSLLRAAGERQQERGYSPNKQDLTDTGMLFRKLWRHPPQYTLLPFEYLEAIATEDKMIVFLVHNGQPAMFEDDLHLFPSDKLINALRLLL